MMETIELAVDYAQWGRDMAAYAAKVFRSRNPTVDFKAFISQGGCCTFVLDDPECLTETVDAEIHRFIPAGAAITLATVPPPDATLVPIEELLAFSHEMATVHTVQGLGDVLSLRHPALGPIDVNQEENLALRVLLPESKKDADLSALKEDLDRLPWKRGTISILFQRDERFGGELSKDDVFFIGRQDRRTQQIRALKHVRADDERWYKGFEEAVEGRLPSNSLPASIGRRKRTIFLPSGEFNNLPDLRNYFLLYDHVLMEVPLSERFEKRADGVSIEDLAEAAGRNRLQLLITQPEERLPLQLLQAVEERNAEAIIGRRAGAAFAMAVYTERLSEFERRNDKESLTSTVRAQALQTILGLDRGTATRLLSSPVSDYYSAIERLRHADIKALPYSGGEDAWNFFRKFINLEGLPDLALEFQVASSMTGIGSLFGAEVALGQKRNPITAPAEITSTLSAFFGGEQEINDAIQAKSSQIAQHPEGPLFDFSQSRPLAQLLDVIDEKRSGIARSILSDLASLPECERNRRILEINDLVHDFGGLPSELVIGKGMPVRWANLIVQGLAMVVAPLGLLLGIAQIADGGTAFFRDVQRLKSLGNDVAKSRRQVEMLASIRKVARLDERR